MKGILFMPKSLSGLFKSPHDETEESLLKELDFLLKDCGFSYSKEDLGNATDKKGRFKFYGPLYAYQFYNDGACINILYLVQRQEFDVYVTEEKSANQTYIRSGTEIPSELAYNLPLLAMQIKDSILNNTEFYGRKLISPQK